jgi:hypothetical protein
MQQLYTSPTLISNSQTERLLKEQSQYVNLVPVSLQPKLKGHVLSAIVCCADKTLWPHASWSCQYLLYFSALPFAFSTGYFFSFISSFFNIISEESNPRGRNKSISHRRPSSHLSQEFIPLAGESSSRAGKSPRTRFGVDPGQRSQ